MNKDISMDKFNNKIKFSIITVCFNSESTIERTIKSVLDQSYSNFEYIIVDGKSSDSTMDIVKSYEDKFNGKLKYVSEKDTGIYNAMNKGIRMACGDIVGIINSDDFYEKDTLKHVLDAYKCDVQYQVCYGMMRVVKEDGTEHSIDFKNKNVLGQFSLPHPSTFITKSIYDKYCLYDESYKISADFDLLLKLSQIKDVVFTPVYKVLSNFSIGGVSLSADAYFLTELETLQIKYKYGIINSKEYRIKKLKLMLKKFL